MMGAQDTVKKVSFKDRISNILGTIRMAAGQAPGQGVGFAGFNPEGALHKAVIPEYLYRPPYGYPRMSNIPEIRRLAATPYVAMGVNTIVNEVCGVPWGVYPKDKERADDKKLLARCDEAKQFLENPNVNEESFRDILTMYVTDMIEINTGILNKVYNLKGELKELYAKDGGTFTKNPDIFGTFADRADYVLPTFNINLIQHAGQYDEWMKSVNKEPAYFQYGGTVGVRPMPFGRREIIFTINNSRTNQIYGWSPVEILLDVIQLLVYGITTNLEYYTDNNIPKGVGAIIGANQDQIDAFTKRWKDKMTKKDQVGDIVKKYHEIPFVGQEVKFERIQFSNVELELLEQQKWFTKIAWAMLGVTPGELGFTEDENLAVEKEQSKVFRKKTIRSLLQKITYSLNSQLVWTDFSDEIEFRFDIDNLDDEKEKLEIYEMKLRNDIMTVNEVRHELGLEPLKGGS